MQVTLTAQGQEQADTLLEVVPPSARNLARLKVADAASQPLFQAFLDELRQNPQLAQRNQQITQQCGQNPLQSIEEVALFAPQGQASPAPGASQQQGSQPGVQQRGQYGGQQPETGTQGSETQVRQGAGQSGAQPQGASQRSAQGMQGQGGQGQGSAAQAAQSAQMLIQLNRPTSWAFQCLSAMRNDVSQAQVGGRAARSIGQFMVIDAGNNRLLVTRRQAAPAALQRMIQAGQTDTGQANRAAQRVENLGDPLLFSTGSFANRLGLKSAETVMTQDGDALQLEVTGTMNDAETAQNTVQRLQTGLNIAAAFLGSHVSQQQGAQQGMTEGGQAPTTGGARGPAGQGPTAQGPTTQGGAAQEDPQEILRSVIDGVRIESRGETVRLAVNLPDAETQRFLGGVLARFLAEGGAQRLMEQRPQQQQQRQQQQVPGRTGGATGGG